MQLYNSFRGQKEPFVIPTDRPTTMYVCGVTPYDTTHVGHARTYLVFDVLLRYMRWHGAEILYCQNVTDVDDPLFERAERDNIHWYDLAQREVDQFVRDCAGLNMVKPTYFPKASEEIDTIITLVEQLVAMGYGYVRQGNVYFSIKRDPHFGEMARMGYAEMLAIANERGNFPNDPHKDDPLDFVLWHTGKPGDPTWESPWGAGRPGWHIECSAMAMRYLGPQIDLHGGGSDLLFPHHACEIAQSEKVSGKKPFSRFWLHVGMVYLDGEKMSKSLGNLVFVRDALKDHEVNALRWYLLSKPYQEKFDYHREQVDATQTVVSRFTHALEVPGGTGSMLDITRGRDAFDAALADNMDTPKALAILADIGEQIHTAADEGRDIADAQTTLATLAEVVGFLTVPQKR
jgi:L-cysteine:1D-myo-inositol 2-amino-2-deoxy-alpha-D-glucopyranoside ligase